MSGQTVDEDPYLTFMASMGSSEKEMTQFLEEQADFFTITITPPTALCSHNFLVEAKLQCFYTYCTALISLQHTCSCS